MNSLLKRQIRKFLSEDLKKNKDLTAFFNAVDLSYNNFEDQTSMIQRAMRISSEELYTANRKLQNETNEQKEVIEKLKNVINTLKFYNLNETEKPENIELTGSNLVDFIDNKTKQIVEMNKYKQALLNELALQNQELSDYAHMVSHDLKSSLRSIYALTCWLSEDYIGVIDDNGKKSLDLIRSNVEKMDVLISDILDYSTIGKNQIQVYDVDLNKLIDAILATIQVPQHISITKVNLPIVKGDKHRLKQLFNNLIINAVKYNDKAKGTVEINVEDKSENWLFSIKDNGKGIEETYFNKIFKTFIKLEHNPESTGIGLSIVKKIVELYGGKIWLESQVDIGTTFYFNLKKSINGKA